MIWIHTDPYRSTRCHSSSGRGTTFWQVFVRKMGMGLQGVGLIIPTALRQIIIWKSKCFILKSIFFFKYICLLWKKKRKQFRINWYQTMLWFAGWISNPQIGFNKSINPQCTMPWPLAKIKSTTGVTTDCGLCAVCPLKVIKKKGFKFISSLSSLDSLERILSWIT